MASAGGVIDQKDIAGTKAPLGSVADLDLAPPGQVDHILPSRSPMPVVDSTGRSVAEDDAIPGLELLDLNLDLVEMRLAIRSGIDSRDFHGFALIEKSRVKSN